MTMSLGCRTWSGCTAGRSWITGPSMRRRWAISSATCWFTRSATILGYPTTIWRRSRRPQVRPICPLIPDAFAINQSRYTQFSTLEVRLMEKFTTLEGVAAPLKIINVDTDMIIPKQYLKTIKRTGLGKGLFSEQRYKDDGSDNPDFILNKPAYRNAKVLVAGDNFGCGSSREHAPWALMDFGIRCVISTSFGDIFYNNCFKNGVLPIKVTPEDLEKLFDDAERGANATLTIDLEKQEIRGPDGGVVKFEIDPHRKHCLLNGLDDIGLTMVKQDKVERFEERAKAARPWA